MNDDVKLVSREAVLGSEVDVGHSAGELDCRGESAGFGCGAGFGCFFRTFPLRTPLRYSASIRPSVGFSITRSFLLTTGPDGSAEPSGPVIHESPRTGPICEVFGLFGLGTISQEARRAVFRGGGGVSLFRHWGIAP